LVGFVYVFVSNVKCEVRERREEGRKREKKGRKREVVLCKV